MNINNYSFKPEAHFFTFNNYSNRSNEAKYFGLEVETEYNGNEEEKIEAIENINSKEYREQIYLKQDGSLNNGIEIITHPFTYEFLKSNKFKLFEFINSNIIGNGFGSFKHNTTGTHIHLSKNHFNNKLHLLKFILFFKQNYWNIFNRISERRSKHQVKYFCRNIKKTELRRATNGTLCNRTRYTMLNITSNTIECRIFQANLRSDRILKNIEFLKCLIEFTELEKINKNFTSWSKFKVFVNNSSYENLKQFLTIKKRKVTK